MSAADGDPGTLLERLLSEAEALPPDSTPGGMADSMAAGLSGSLSGGMPETAPQPDLSALLKLAGPLMTGGAGRGGRTSDRHTALLKALKPYLAPQRRAAVDTLLTVSGLWDSLSGLGADLPAQHGPTSAEGGDV